MPFTAVDLSLLPAPNVVEPLSATEIFNAMLADLQVRDTVFNALVASDPAYKILEVCAYREYLIRQRVNDASYGNMLAYATGSDLDQIAALPQFNVTRLTITPANPATIPPTPAVMESDADLRARIQLAVEGWTTAGSEGAYKFWGLSSDPDVLDIGATTVPASGTVDITVLSRTGDGTASGSLITTVTNALSAEEIRPLTDDVNVTSATINTYTIDATITFYPGPDSAVVLAAAQSAIETFVADNHRIGRDVTLSGIYAALHQPGVAGVTLTLPAADVTATDSEANYCSTITLTDGGVV